MAECAMQGIADEDCSLIKKVYDDFLRSNFWILMLVVVMYLLSNISRAFRWNMMLKTFGVQPKFSNSFFSIMLGYFANLGLPRIGEVIRAATLAKYEKTRMDKVMGTVVLDRAVDAVFLAGFLLLSLVVGSAKLIGFLRENSDLSAKVESFLYNPMVIAGTIGLVVGLIVLFRSKKIRQSAFGQKITNFLVGILDGLKSIGSLDKPLVFILHSFIIWILYFLMLYVGFSAFEPTAHLSIAAGIVVFTLGGIGFIIPSPGGMGTYHFLITTGLTMYGINGADGFSLANILFFTINIFANILFGLLALVLLPVLNMHNR